MRFVTTCLFFLMISAACAGSGEEARLTAVAPQREALAADCLVELRPRSEPPGLVRPLAFAVRRCPGTDDRLTRASCSEATRADACAAGADVSYRHVFRRDRDGLVLMATLGRRFRYAPSALRVECRPSCGPGFTCDAGFCVESCEPTCDDGYACEAGACVALCNPACGEGSVCSDERLCTAEGESATEADDGEVASAEAEAPTETAEEPTEAGVSAGDGEPAETAEASEAAPEADTEPGAEADGAREVAETSSTRG